MARSGSIIEHPVWGEKAILRQTAADTNGELLQLDAVFRPGGSEGPESVHPRQEERFQVLSGTFSTRVGGKLSCLGAGEELTVPRGAAHTRWNEGDEEAHVILEMRPALKTEEWLETFYGLARDGKTNRKTGMPALLQTAVILNQYPDEIRLAQPPYWLQWIIFGVLALVGRRLGYRALYPRYSSSGTRGESDLAA
ncbi:MAG: cupin domain-containing protein [Chloroflexota bacterium]